MPTAQRPAPLPPAEVRPWPLKSADPLALLVGGVFVVLGSVRLFSALGMSADDVAQAQAGILMLGAAVRWWLEVRNAAKVAAMAEQREAKAHRVGLMKPQPRPRRRVGADGEGGLVVIDGDDTPVEDPARVDRRG